MSQENTYLTTYVATTPWNIYDAMEMSRKKLILKGERVIKQGDEKLVPISNLGNIVQDKGYVEINQDSDSITYRLDPNLNPDSQ